MIHIRVKNNRTLCLCQFCERGNGLSRLSTALFAYWYLKHLVILRQARVSSSIQSKPRLLYFTNQGKSKHVSSDRCEIYHSVKFRSHCSAIKSHLLALESGCFGQTTSGIGMKMTSQKCQNKASKSCM